MRFTFTRRNKQNKFIFFLGDEGCVLVHSQEKRVLRRLFAVSPDPINTRPIQDILASDPRAAIYFVIDMIDQSFVRSSFPPVTALSINKLIKRRLDKDFGKNDLKGSVPLGREKKGRKDWNFVLASLANSPLLGKWIDFIIEYPNPFRGIYLLPLESEKYIKALVDSNNMQPPAEWQLLVSHNKVSGFRQVVLQNGRMAFTRLAQPVGEMLPEIIAGNIEQEIINTTEYLKRLGYSDQAGLDVYIIASAEIKEAISKDAIKSLSTHIFTPNDVATSLALQQAATTDDHFGDVVFSAFFSTIKKHALSLQSPITEKIAKLSLIARSIRYATYATSTAILLYCANIGYQAYITHQEIDGLESRKRQNVVTLTKIKQETKQLPLDIEHINDVLILFTSAKDKELHPFWILEKLRKALPETVLVKNIDWNLRANTGGSGNDSPVGSKNFSGNFEIEFTGQYDNLDDLGNFAKQTMVKIKDALKPMSVTNSALPGVVEESQAIQADIGKTGGALQNNPDSTNTVKITIIGPHASTKPAS